MKRNVGNWDRWMRAVAGVAVLVYSPFAPFSLAVRVAVFAATGIYLLYSAVAGTCFGYLLMGQSTCPVQRQDVT